MISGGERARERVYVGERERARETGKGEVGGMQQAELKRCCESDF